MADAGRIVIIPKGEYKSNVTYERLDAVLYNGKGYIALKTVTGVTPAPDGENWQIYVDNVNIDIDNLTSNFDLASERKNILTGETLSTIFGKIKKYFSDIKDHAYKDLATSWDVTTKGTALDATVANALNEKLKKQLADHTVKSDVPEDAKFTDTTYEQATDETLGLVKIDSELSSTSENAVKNKIVTAEISALKKDLNTNGYGKVAGGKNLLSPNVIRMVNCLVLFSDDIFYATNKGSWSSFIISVPTVVGKTYILTIKDWSDYSYHCILSVSDTKDDTIVSTVILEKTFHVTFTATSKETYIHFSPNNTSDSKTNTITFKGMLEEGSEATAYEPYFPSNKMLLEEKADKSETTVNLLNPTLQTTTRNGITYTNNGDGTYTLNGTATTADNDIPLSEKTSVIKGTKYAFFGSTNKHVRMYIMNGEMSINDTGNRQIFTYEGDSSDTKVIHLLIDANVAINNVIIKPMLTTNLNATIDDFVPYTGDTGSLNKDVADIRKEVSQTVTHNMPRIVPKDITSYITDGTFYKRLNGTDGFDLFEDIYIGDYIKMSRPITCPNQDSSAATTGSQYVTIIGLDTLQGNGDNIGMDYHHAVMTAGQGFGGTQHFGRHRMNSTGTTAGGYVGSEMNTSVLGAVTSSGSTASDATINQQLYAEFGSHLKTTRELCSNSINASGYNRFGSNTGCSNNWVWGSYQAILMSEVEVYGSIVWSSSGYDTGNAKMQMPLFTHNRQAMNNRSSWYWLKDVASGTYFCLCDGNGYASCYDASSVWYYVRPRFVIGA